MVAQVRNLRAASSGSGNNNNGRRGPGLREGGQPPGRRETKLETFRRLAQHRVTNVVKTMTLVAKLGNREIYEIRPSDVDAIEVTLKAAVEDTIHALRHGGKAPPVIKFDDC